MNENEPQPDDTMPECPDHLSERAQIEWHRTGPLLHKIGLLTEIDKAAFAGAEICAKLPR